MASQRVLQRSSRVDFFHHHHHHSSTPARLRMFTHKPSLLLVAKPIARPQLPFLHSVARVNIVQAHVGRFISTERKQRWKDNFWQQVRFHSWLWPSVFLVIVVTTGLKHVELEREYPTPREWGFWSRWTYRMAKYTEFDEGAKIHRVLTDWGAAAVYYKDLLERLESAKYDGKDLDSSVRSDGDGFDISGKSEAWRRGYVDTLMGAARVAEHLDGMCRRKGDPKGRVYPRESIPGPDNPRPKPLPWEKNNGHEKPPSVDEVEDAFPPPQTFYRQILTTEGLTTRQRLDAALAYADWVDFSGSTEVAEKEYQTALKIACRGLSPDLRGSVVDWNSGVINKGHEEDVTDNVLKASTALGVYYAKAGRVKDALPIFLSVLRARKSLPPSPFGATGQKKKPKSQEDILSTYLLALKDLLIEPPYPPPPPNGDDRPYHTLAEACEEVGLMTYIGEILFATSESEREKGLSWTRDSVEAAEAVLWVMEEQKLDVGREKCRECLDTGLQNWKDMAREMARLAAKREVEAQSGSGMLGLGLGKSQLVAKAHEERQRWEEEKDLIELKRQKTLPLTQLLNTAPPTWQTTRV